MTEQPYGLSKTARVGLILLLALACAFAIAIRSSGASYEERLIRAGLQDALGAEARGLLTEPADVQAVLLDYAQHPELLVKARLAIAKYGDDARAVLVAYGSEAEFQAILSAYGENVVPVIQYFIDHDPRSVRSVQAAKGAVERLGQRAQQVWEQLAGRPLDAGAPEATAPEWSPTARGWYAITSIQAEGHDFLGQFAIGADRKAQWIQTERVLEGLTSFFASGVNRVERKYRLDQQLEAADLFWAGVDAALVVSAAKALRTLRLGAPAGAGRAGSAGAIRGTRLGSGQGASATLRERTRLFGARLLPRGALGRAIVKTGAVGAMVYLVVMHPGLLNSVFDETARALGIDPLHARLIGWTVLISAALAVLLPVVRLLLPPLVVALRLLVSAVLHLHGVLSSPRRARH
ncbi:MAG: hypothetical protein ABIS17_08255 [Casimicrobiaceae bacterium]